MDRTKIEDIFRLSEVQEAMLVHLHGAADTGFLQLRGSLVGHLRVDVFEQAWRQTIGRHPVLRSAIHWKELKHPVQVVSRHADVTVDHRDWRGVSEDERGIRLAHLLEEDRERGIDITRAPVMRLTLLQEADDRHSFLWACHHILLDGWSGAIVLREVFAWYDALLQGREPALEPARPFREYVAWVRATDHADAAEFWRWRLAGRHRDSCLGRALSTVSDRPQAAAPEVASTSFVAAGVEAWASQHRMTVSSLLLGCWGLLLHERTSAERPVMGVTVSGRAAAFDGIESMVGMFANTLPLALSVDRLSPAPVWFRDVFQRQQEIQRFEHCSLGRVLRWGGISLIQPLFDTLVVNANYPKEKSRTHGDGSAAPGTSGRLHLLDFHGGVTSAYPLTLVIGSDREIRVDARFHRDRFDHEDVTAILGRFEELVTAVVSGSAPTIGDVLGRRVGDLRQRRKEPQPDRGRVGAPSSRRVPESHATLEPAATPVEAQLMRIWDDLIDIKEIGREDNFFELGGHSLLIPWLIDRVHRDFGVTLPLGVVFQAPTVKGLAEFIRSRNANPSWQSLVGIREGGRPPLYLVHGLGGEIGYFYNLAQYLHPDQPLYGIQPPVDPSSDLESIAARYLAEIRRHQPRGPYLLGGFCVGGCIAFEMARQLVDGGESVRLLAIIDSAVPGTRPGLPPTARRLRQLVSKGPRGIAAAVGRRASAAAERLSGHGGAAMKIDDMPRWGSGIPRAFHDIATQHYRAVRDYAPRPYPGDVWLFRSRDDRFAHDLGWGAFVQGRLDIEMIPGNHSDVLKEPYLRETARQLSAVVDASTTAKG